MSESRKEFVKVWFNPQSYSFEFYTAGGEEIRFAADAEVTINDNFGNEHERKLCSVKIVLLADLVKDKPQNVRYYPTLPNTGEISL